MMAALTLLWFRQDLRLEDNPALAAAIERGAVIPVYIGSPEREGAWAPGGAARWWLHHALADLGEQLAARGVRLLRRAGEPGQALQAETGATAVDWNRRYEPAAVLADPLPDLRPPPPREGWRTHAEGSRAGDRRPRPRSTANRETAHPRHVQERLLRSSARPPRTGMRSVALVSGIATAEK